MSTVSNTGVVPVSMGATHSNDTIESELEPLATKAEVYARAEQRMHRGKRLVMSGFVVAVLGVIGYCAVSFGAGINQEVGASVLEDPGPLLGPALGVIGLGTLLWLVGSFDYLMGAMDSDPDGPDIDF